jgi:agmatine deiminase
MHRVAKESYRFHILKTDRSWLRDSAPTAIGTGKNMSWIEWKFNAWAKYENFHADAHVPELVSHVSGKPIKKAFRSDTRLPLVLEGGAIETDGQGTLIVTEECLQSEIQCRNPGYSRLDYEKAFKEYLGIEQTIWIVGGCDGDDTHGHIDDVARFVAPGKVLLAFENDSNQHFHQISKQNEAILNSSSDARGQKLEVMRLPMPREIFFGDERLPASYANFYIANKSVLVPTFNDVNDAEALMIIKGAFPEREVIGISAIDLVLGFGTLHCLTQQEPL